MSTEEDLKNTEEGEDEARVKSEDEIEAEKAGKADDAAREAASSPMQLRVFTLRMS